MSSESQAEDPGTRARWFTSTHWSVVLAAGQEDSPSAQAALEKLCQVYWPPLYAYARRRKFNPEDSQDLTQEFFARFLAGNYLRTVHQSRGKFRCYLLKAFQHFLSNEWDKTRAIKRGAGKSAIPLDDLNAEHLYNLVATNNQTPEESYDQSWAFALLEHVQVQLKKEYHDVDKSDRFDHLVQFLPGESSPISYVDAARQMEISEEAVRSEVYRLRKRYRELVRHSIAQTVATPADIDEEVHYLITVLSRSQ